MKIIPQRELRNQSGEVLRAAEAGEQFTITVDGRPVAILGPLRKRQWVPRAEIERILATPTDESVLDDIKGFDNFGPRDPWAER
ncbi:MAG: type II toxin-antitoxin system Phd/YefM family antitoxin [Actinomycetota bacterium]